MPNYRQKNRNRNKNKNRNKQQQQQQQQQQQNSETSSDHTAADDTPPLTTHHPIIAVESPAPLEQNVSVVVDANDASSLNEQHVITCGTVSPEPANATCHQSPSQTQSCNVETNEKMGNEKSTPVHSSVEEPPATTTTAPRLNREVTLPPRQQAKVIVHRIVCDESAKSTPHSDAEVHETAPSTDNQTENWCSEEEEASVSAKTNSESESEDVTQKQVTVIVHQIHVERRDSDNDNEPSALSPVHIEEVGDDSLTDVEELRSPIVSEVDSAAEWEDGDFEETSETETTSVTQREKRKQKRIALENHFLPQMLNPRFLDSISEENSDISECGENPLSRSASAESAANNTTELKAQKLNAKFPKSSLDFSKTHKHMLTVNTHTNQRNAIREEPLAFAVEARFQDSPAADESCTMLRGFLSPESELAEMVFINSASSSMSDLNDMDVLDRVSLHSASSAAFGLDTDARDLINKPGAENRELKLTSSSSATEIKMRPINTDTDTDTDIDRDTDNDTDTNDDKGSHFVNNCSRIPSSSSSPAVHQLVFSNTVEEQQPQSSSMLRSCGSGHQQRFADDDAQFLLSDTQARSLETSCDSVNTSSVSSLRADKNAKPPSQVLTEDVEKIMNSVRDILNTDNTQTANANDPIKLNTTTTTTTPTANREDAPSPIDPKKLRLLCTETLASLPFGGEVLEELATLAQNIGEVRAVNVINTHTTTATTDTEKRDNNMPYPLPELPHIDDLQLCLNKPNTEAPQRPSSPNHPDSWLGVPTSSDPKVLVCLSPSQRSYIEQQHQQLQHQHQHHHQQQQHIVKTTTTNEPQKADDLLDAHQKFVERRGYHEYTKEQLAALEQEKMAEQQLLQTAAIMKKLRKSITPPPPQIPPPPVPAKSSETATIAQNLSKRSMAPTSSTTNTQTIQTNDDVTAVTETETTSARCCDGEENKHRLLSIIQDTSDSRPNHSRQQQKVEETATSSFENNSRQTTSIHQQQQQQQQQQQRHPATPQQSPSTFIVPITLTNGSSAKTYNSFPPSSSGNNMQSVESSLGEMFPTLGSSDIFDKEHKRFSNVESSTSHHQPPSVDAKPKRYSSVETRSFETQKRIENGQVVHDFSNTKHERQNYGDALPTEGDIKFPSKSQLSSGPANFSSAHNPFGQSMQSILTADTAKTDDHEIMSALKLNKHSSDAVSNSSSSSNNNNNTINRTANNITSSTSITSTSEHSQSKSIGDEVDFVKQKQIEEQQKQNASKERMTALRRGIEDTYEEFRQRAKESAIATANVSTDAGVLPSAQLTSNGDGTNGSGVMSSSSSVNTVKKAAFQHDHEKLFKEFDDLSQQLHKELETSKTQREQKERSASLFDLNRIQLRQREQIEEFNKQRHEHMKELEKEIDRSLKSRQQRLSSIDRTYSGDVSNGRAYEIPIQLENGYAAQSSSNGEEAPPVPEPPRTYQIPIQMENTSSSADDSRFRRAESMFNLNEDGRRVHTYSNQQRIEDDWTKYASDLGSSENIARPFAREVEICYQRRPGGIRAPRMTASTNDLSYNSHSYDQYNAYNVRRSQAPMLHRAPQQTRPQYGSCYSMIERDPNPKYISTTTRRGVSPAPQPSGFHPMEVNVSEDDMRQRRASLPRELHEQQLKYIMSKEEELRTEFERLQNERRRLMEEVSRTPTAPTMPQPTPRPMGGRETYRCVPKLPTLTEDEVFRQQMAEEWLNKVAEREKRRLHNIIKISKLHEEETASDHKTLQKNLGDEFLNRVKERRSKLAMPADSDWESGAESHPVSQAQFSETEDVPPVKILEGDNEANLRSLPRHLREFAKFSNHERDVIEGGHREQHQEEERSQETTDNSVSKAFKKSTVVKTVKTLRAPMLPENGGHGRIQGKANGYQSEPEPSYDSDYSTVKYRPVNPQRLHSVSSALNVRSSNDKIYGTLPNPVRSGQSTYKNQPGRIEDYVTGHSSVSEKETKEQLDQAKLSSQYTEGNLSRALAKESGYTSDSNLVIRKRELPPNSPLSPVEQKQAYKSVQAGGEPPLFGFRKPAPEKSKDYDLTCPLLPPPPKGEYTDQVSPNRYYESDVNIHFKTPVRQEFKSPLSEEELTARQAEHMQKLYQEERRRKYLQELQDMNSRRHTDNFTPSQKSPIALNRYDDFPADLAPKAINQTKSVARALYNFQAQNSKELSFKKGDVIYIRRAIDKNWYEGEHNAMIGLFPANYVEVINKETVPPIQSHQPIHRKPSEGQARAKYNFQAQSGVELSLNKGELVSLTRRVDDNWFEGRIANRKGIFPVSYVEVLTDIGAEDIAARTTTVQHVSTVSARPSLDALRTNINNEFNTLTRNGVQAPNSILRETRTNQKTDILHVDTSSEPLVYRALYKYRPQNSDELELFEGDIVHVLEKCDDGWYVGTSQRTGCFGTFPGNYVERL